MNSEVQNQNKESVVKMTGVSLDTPKEASLDTPKEASLDTPKAMNWDFLKEEDFPRQDAAQEDLDEQLEEILNEKPYEKNNVFLDAAMQYLKEMNGKSLEEILQLVKLDLIDNYTEVSKLLKKLVVDFNLDPKSIDASQVGASKSVVDSMRKELDDLKLKDKDQDNLQSEAAKSGLLNLV